VATPMSRYTKYQKSRSSWRGAFSSVGVVVTAEDGSWGFGATEYGAPTISLINDHIGPLLGGENALATERLYDMMMRIMSAYSPIGLASYAISGIDLALWDLKGRLLKLPVYELSGGPARERQLCYATGNDTDWHMELGFKGTKLACPYGAADGLEAIEKNEFFVAKARETVGPHVELMLDCWMSFDVEFAVRLAQRLQPYRLKWIEDCLVPEDIPSHMALRNRLPWQTLAAGEHWYTPYTFFAAAKDRLVDILQPDIAWVGGFTAMQRVTAFAHAAGLEVICHAGMNTPYGQHFAIASPNSLWGEFYLGSAPGVPLDSQKRYPGLATPKNGFVTVSDEPGFGHGLSLEAINEMAL
jgi:L-rhamnonate dehydratase